MGAYLGAGFGNNSLSTNVGTVTGTSYFTTSADINAVNSAGSWSNNPNTVVAGLEIGHDWVWKELVYGAVIDYGALSLSSSKTVTNIYPSNANSYSVYTAMNTHWLYTLRGRLGYQNTFYWPSILYFTGGMAMTQITVKNSFSDNTSLAGAGGDTLSKNQIGWTAGAGVEFAVTDHASLGLEYLYVSVPSVTTTSSIANTQGGFGIPIQSLTNPFSTKGKLYANLLKLTWNYRIDE